jgi:hypothetical protein
MGNEHGELAVETKTRLDTGSKDPRRADPAAPGGRLDLDADAVGP